MSATTWISQHRLLTTAGVLLGAAIIAFAVWRHSNDEKVKRADAALDSKAASQESSGPNTLRMDNEAQKNVGLRVDRAQSRSVVQTIRTTGTVGPNETRVAHMRPITRGRILKVNARLGDQIRQGEALATYDNIELGEAVGQYGVGLAELKRAQAGAEVARRSTERAQNLVELGAVARAELERRSAEYANAQSAIETQRAELARIEEKLHRFGMTDEDIQEMNRSGDIQRHREVSQSTLRAPFSGVITNVNVVEGETVETDREMFTIVDLSALWVQASIYENDIGAVRRGVPAIISVDAYPHETFHGRITYISDLLDPKSRTIKVRCEVPNLDGRLKLDMFTTIDIPTPANRQAVMIPASAVQQINDQPIVFVRLSDTEFQKRLVQLGAKDGDWVEAVSGLKAGDDVVTTGSFQLKSIALRELIGEKE